MTDGEWLCIVTDKLPRTGATANGSIFAASACFVVDCRVGRGYKMKLKKMLTLAIAALFVVVAAVPITALDGGSYVVDVTHYPFVAVCAGSVNVNANTHTGTLEWNFNLELEIPYLDEDDYRGSITKKYYDANGDLAATSVTRGDWGVHIVHFSHAIPNYSISSIEHTHKLNNTVLKVKTIY